MNVLYIPAILHDIQYERCLSFIHKLDCLLFKPQGYDLNF